MAIIQNVSPLTNGQAGLGESEIRKYIIENDWLEYIIQLPTDLFYNTTITTYIWVISKNKNPIRKGKCNLSMHLKGKPKCHIINREDILNRKEEFFQPVIYKVNIDVLEKNKR